MIKYIFYIIILVFSTNIQANQRYIGADHNPISVEINADINYIHSFTDEFLDTDDDDLLKYILPFLRKDEVNIIDKNDSIFLIIESYTNKINFLNSYLDLPPPALT